MCTDCRPRKLTLRRAGNDGVATRANGEADIARRITGPAKYSQTRQILLKPSIDSDAITLSRIAREFTCEMHLPRGKISPLLASQPEMVELSRRPSELIEFQARGDDAELAVALPGRLLM